LDLIQDPYVAKREFLARLFRRLGCPDPQGDDLVQDVLLKFLEKGYAHRDLTEAQAKALLARIAYTTLIDRKRRNARFGHRSLDGLPEAQAAPEREIIRWVRELLFQARLAPDELRLVRGRFVDGKSLADLAAAEHCHVNTVRRRLGLLLDRLRREATRDLTDAGRR